MTRVSATIALAASLAAVCATAAVVRMAPDVTAGAGFVNTAAEAGLVYPTYSGPAAKTHIRETLGQGACWTDFDRDGDVDLFVVNGARQLRPHYAGHEHLLESWRLYENRNGRFVDVAAHAGIVAAAWGVGCAAGDVDADGFDDLVVTTAAGPNLLLRNQQGRRFVTAPLDSKPPRPTISAGAAFGDLDRDGDLDLVVANYLDESTPLGPAPCRWKGIRVMCGPKGYRPLDAQMYLNDGAGRFAATPPGRGLAGQPSYGLGIVLFDAENDGDSDVYVAGDSSPSRLFLNRGDGTFRERGLAAGVALSVNGATQAGMGVDAGDLDGDGLIDLVKTNFSDDINNFYRNDGGGVFTDWAHRSGLSGSPRNLGWAVITEDFDLDADLDVFVVNGHVYPEVDGAPASGTSYRQRMQMFFNDGRGRFTDVSARMGPEFANPIAGRSAAAADVDRDGDMDLLVTRDGEPPLLLMNNVPRASSPHWLSLRVRSRSDNHEGIGARISLETALRRQVREVRRSRGYLSSGEAVVVFGLSSDARVDRLTIRWPSGRTQVATPPQVDREWVIEEAADARPSIRSGKGNSS